MPQLPSIDAELHNADWPKRSRDLVWPYSPTSVVKHGTHDQMSHGNWAHNVGLPVDDVSENELFSNAEGYHGELLDDYYGEWFDELDNPTKNASAWWQTFGGFRTINEALRSDDPISPHTQRAIDTLDAMIDSAPGTWEDIVVHRAFNGEQFRLDTGSEFHDHGFIATSNVKEGAEAYGAPDQMVTLRAEILIPAGTQVAPMFAFNHRRPVRGDGPGYDFPEDTTATGEILLPRGAKFRVLGNYIDEEFDNAKVFRLLYLGTE